MLSVSLVYHIVSASQCYCKIMASIFTNVFACEIYNPLSQPPIYWDLIPSNQEKHMGLVWGMLYFRNFQYYIYRRESVCCCKLAFPAQWAVSLNRENQKVHLLYIHLLYIHGPCQDHSMVPEVRLKPIICLKNTVRGPSNWHTAKGMLSRAKICNGRSRPVSWAVASDPLFGWAKTDWT